MDHTSLCKKSWQKNSSAIGYRIIQEVYIDKKYGKLVTQSDQEQNSEGKVL